MFRTMFVFFSERQVPLGACGEPEQDGRQLVFLRSSPRKFLRKPMKNEGMTMIPGVEPILLDLENPLLPARDLKNRRKT